MLLLLLLLLVWWDLSFIVVGLAGFIIYCCWIYLGQTLLGTHGQGWALSVLGADRRDDPGTHTVVTVP